MMERYNSYKDSGVEWIGEIPSHWGRKRLKHIVEYVNGYSFKSDEFDKEKDIPVIRIGDVGDKIDFEKCVKVDSRFLIDRNDFIIKRNDILIGLTGGTIGKSGRYNYNSHSLLNQRVGLLRNTNSVLNGLLYFYVKSEVFIRYIFFDCYGGGQDNIGMGDILNMVFPLPPLSEQQQIVEFLKTKTSLIDSLIEKTQKKIELLKEKRTSLINHTVIKGLNPNVEMKDSGVEWIGEIPSHWENRNGSTIGFYSKGKGIKKDEVKDSGNPCVRYGEIYTKYNHIVKGVTTFIDDKTTETSISINTDSLLLTGSGETKEEIGKCIVYTGSDTLWIGGDIIIIKPKKDLYSVFLSYLINSECIRVQREMSGKGEIIVHIYSKNFKEMRYPIPPISEQQQIVEYLDEQTNIIDTTITKEQKRVELLKEYRQSLISEVVTGKIKVCD